MKIYTKTGDSGTTSLFGGRRVEKNSAMIKAYGEVDELNSLLGVIIVDLQNYSSSPSTPLRVNWSREVSSRRNSPPGRIVKKLLRIQNELFVLGADLATPFDVKTKVPRITKAYISRLEREIDNWEKELPKLNNFILPGGGKIGAKLHLARTIARRAERSIVELESQEKINQSVLVYINRLSDWLFVLARYVNKLEDVNENIWRGRSLRK